MQINGDELGIFLYYFKDLDSFIEKCEKEKLLKFDKDYKITLKGKRLLQNLKIEGSLSADDKFVEDYLSVFKSYGRSLKPGTTGNKQMLKKKLNEFLKNNKYTKDEILIAIQNYVNSQRESNYRYLQKAHYTVSKVVHGEKESKLLEFCEELEEGNSDQKEFKQMI